MEEKNKHLWDVKHDYYCSESNHYHAGELKRFDSWNEFYEAYGTADPDMNLLFRWDWRGGDIDTYTSDILELFYILQRKGIFRPIEVQVSKKDELVIKEWLNIQFDHLFKLWEPIA